MLAERDTELARLASLLNQTEPSGRVVALCGEAGIGKTALLREFAKRHSESCQCIWGICDALFTPRPLGPVLDIALALGEFRTDRARAGGPALFQHIFSKLIEIEKSVVVILEDVHWADIGTLDFIRFLGRRIAFSRANMIVSFRNDELGRDHPLQRVLGDIPNDQIDRIELKPLSLGAVSKMAKESGRDAEHLLATTGGNPFFLSEILASPDVARQVPASVQDAVNSRLAYLSPKQIALLEALSIIPVPIVPKIHCGWIDGYEGLLHECLRRSILVELPDGRLRFRHELARLATSQRCSSIELRNLHCNHLAHLLRDPGKSDAGELLHHSLGASDPEMVLHFAPIAAENAARLGAHKEAADYLQTALEFIDEAEPEEAAGLYESWAYEAAIAQRIDDRVIEARRHALTLWRALGDYEKIGDNLRHLARLHWYRGEAVKANRYLDEAISLLEQLDNKRMLAFAYAMRSQVHMLASRMDEAVVWGKRALASVEGESAPEVEVHALNTIGTARMFMGDEQGIVDLERSLELSLASNLHEDAARAFTNLSEYAVDMRNLDLAEDVVERGIAFDTEHDLDSWTFYLLGRKAQLRLEQGRLAEAEAICHSVIDTTGQTLLMKLPARIILARVQVRTGDDQAGLSLEKAHKDALATGEVQYRIPVLFGMLERAWLLNSPEMASRAIKSLDRFEPSSFSLWGRAEYAFWLNLLRAKPGSPRHGSSTAFGPALGGNFTQSGKRFAKIGAHSLAQLCFGLSDNPRTVSGGLAELKRQGASAAVKRLTALLETRGLSRKDITLSRGPYRAARENPFGLTAKEMTVLHCLAKGFSNAQIAEEMSRSQRTVEHHVSAILQKLEVENRTAVMVKLRDQPAILKTTID